MAIYSYRFPGGRERVSYIGHAGHSRVLILLYHEAQPILKARFLLARSTEIRIRWNSGLVASGLLTFTCDSVYLRPLTMTLPI